MGCSSSCESIAKETSKAEEEKLQKGSKKVSFDETQLQGLTAEASLQKFLEIIDNNPIILEEKVTRKRLRDFGL